MRLLERLFDRFRAPKPIPWAADPTDSPIPQQPIEKGRRGERGRDDERVYRVRPGDTLESIALDVYGDAARSAVIAAANRERIGEPPVLYPGQVLQLP